MTLGKVNTFAGQSCQRSGTLLKGFKFCLIVSHLGIALSFGQRLNLDALKRCSKRVFLLGYWRLHKLLRTPQLLLGSGNVTAHFCDLCVEVACFFVDCAFDVEGSGQLLLCLLEFLLVFAAALLRGGGVLKRHACIKQGQCILL